ncbi:MAG: hypothetical protein M3Y13_08875 [Armatimonadota bacterium]|nr:hypothetical protein [Armatimonadota bacterium]
MSKTGLFLLLFAVIAWVPGAQAKAQARRSYTLSQRTVGAKTEVRLLNRHGRVVWRRVFAQAVVPAWSPDGRAVAFEIYYREDRVRHIYRFLVWRNTWVSRFGHSAPCHRTFP